MKYALRGSGKAQLMTIVVLIMFLLMVSALFAFALLNISANGASQSLSVSLSSANYGTLLKQSASLFAKESASRALIVLANYESNPALRKGNLIQSFGFYASNLMVSGILPNDTSGYPQAAMGNLTLSTYNLSVPGQVALGQNVIINETRPAFFQTDPYHLHVSYFENVALNVSGATYRYSIPVNATIALNNTPDLFYAQQGVVKTVKFANIGNLTSLVGGAYAIFGSSNSVGYAYGTVYDMPSSAVSSATCASIPAPFTSAPMMGNLIIATYNSQSMSACIGNYAGLITYILPSSGYSAMPYLVYASSSNVLKSLPSGIRVLLYGPGMDTLNVEGLRNAAANGYYFASPFTPSYMDRSGANFLNQSPNGIFTFSNYGTQVANFNGASSYISTGTAGQPLGSSPRSVFAWVNAPTAVSSGLYDIYWYGGVSGQTGAGLFIYNGNLYVSTPGVGYYSTLAITPNTWHLVGYTYASGATQATVYVDGQSQSTTGGGSAFATASGASDIGLASSLGYYYPAGSVSGVQVYNTALSPSQIQFLYQQGISGLPLSGNSLVGWWPLNGNPNDYSGNGNSGVPTNVVYALPSNYIRDSIFVSATPVKTQPLPGILSCTSNSRCSNPSLPQLYLSSMPLEVQNGYVQTGNFNGQTSYIGVSSSSLVTGSQLTMSFWSDELGPGNTAPDGMPVSQSATYINECYSGEGLFSIYTGTSSQYLVQGGACPTVGVWNHYVATYNGAIGVLYINGAPVASASAGGNLVNGAVTIGQYFSGTYNFNGLISNVQVYGTALTANQVQQLYLNGIYGLPLNNAGLAGWWPLNGNANDYSGNGYNGTAYYVAYPYFSGTYNAPGLSSISSTANEWQALGLANT